MVSASVLRMLCVVFIGCKSSSEPAATFMPASTPLLACGDQFDGNHDFGSAAPLPAEAAPLSVDADRPDFWRVSVPARQFVTFGVTAGEFERTGIRLFGMDGELLESSLDQRLEPIVWFNYANDSVDVVFEVEFPTLGQCVGYEIGWSTAEPVCPFDAAEQESPSSRVLLVDAEMLDLTVDFDSPDEYSISLGSSSRRRVEFTVAPEFLDGFLVRVSDEYGQTVDVDDSGPTRELEWVNFANGNRRFSISVEAEQCTPYTISGDTTFPPWDCANSDVAEPNDVASEAYELSSGPLLDLTMTAADSDFYSIEVPVGHQLVMNGYAFVGDFDLTLWSQSEIVGVGQNSRHVVWSNPAEVDQTVVLEADSDDCAVYDLDWTVRDCTLDDANEPNDTLESATLGRTHLDQVAVGGNSDLFAIGLVQPGESVRVDALFLQADGDIDIYLLDAATGAVLTWTGTWTDDETLSYSVDADGAPADLVVEVVRTGGSLLECDRTPYDLTARVSTAP